MPGHRGSPERKGGGRGDGGGWREWLLGAPWGGGSCCLPIHDCLLYGREERRKEEGEEKKKKRKEKKRKTRKNMKKNFKLENFQEEK
jgi:hypothetical protein